MKHRALMIVLVCLAVNLGWIDNAHSQETQANTKAARGGVAISVNPAGMRHHVPDRWATMSVNGINNGNDDAEELVVVQLGDDKKTQFARRFWIPAGARRQAWLPVHIPKLDVDLQKRIDMTSIQLKESDDGESFQANAVGQPLSNRSLMVSRPGGQTAVIFDSPHDSLLPRSNEFDVLTAIHALRDETGILLENSELVSYSASLLPPQPQSLDSLDQLIIIGEGFLRDSTASARIRQWVRNGGRLWIMADQMSADSIGQLLGDANCFTEFDRIELNELQLDQLNATNGETILSNQWSSDSSIEMVRGLTDADQVLCSIDGWPAALTKEAENGEIFITTVSVAGLTNSDGPLPAFRYASNTFFSSRSPTKRHADVMTSLVDNEIGYRIPPRGTIAAVLGLQLLLVLGVGVWLLKQRRLDRLAIVIPISAAAATLFLVWTGRQNVGSVPPTFASGQIVSVNSAGSEALVDSLSAAYSDTTESLELVASPQTSMSLNDNENSRLLWTDDGKSQWMHLSQPPGVIRHVTSESHLRLKIPWTFKGRFTERGFEGRLSGIKSEGSQDALIVSNSAPSLALTATDATWTGTPANVLPTGQYTSNALLSEKQRQRQSVVRELSNPQRRLFGRQPTLLFWTDAQENGLEIGEPFSRRGSAVFTMPIQFERPVSGTSFTVPANFVRMEVAASKDGFSTLFNTQTGQWLQDRTQAQSTRLDCFLPPSLLPCKLSSADIEIKLTAPSRSLQIDTGTDKAEARIHSESNPNGQIKIAVNDPKQLVLGENGSWPLRIAVSETLEKLKAEKANDSDAIDQLAKDKSAGLDSRIWQIEHLRITLSGVTQ